MSTSPHKTSPTILIVLIAGIGDLILASKSIRAIRNGYPDAEIHLLTSTEASTLAVNYEYVDYVHTFPLRELRALHNSDFPPDPSQMISLGTMPWRKPHRFSRRVTLQKRA